MTALRKSTLVLVLVLGLGFGSPALAKNKNSVEETQMNEALKAMAAGPLTVAGPGHVVVERSGTRTIYNVVSGGSLPVCVTLRNRGPKGRVKLVVPGEPDQDGIPVGITIASCFSAPTEIQIRCGGDAKCQAVWRIDRF